MLHDVVVRHDVRKTVLLVAAWLAIGTGALQAQRAAQLRPDQPVAGSLVAADRSITDWGRFKLFTFRGEGGQHLRFSVDAVGLTPILLVARDLGGFTDWIKTSEGADSSATIRYQVQETADYLLVVIAKEADALGSFNLAMTTFAMNPPVTRSIGRDTTVSGTFTQQTAYDYSAEETYDHHTVTVSAGERLEFIMRSPDFDTYLVVGRIKDGELLRLAVDDDGYFDTDSRLVYTFTEPGEYVIRAASYGEATGNYTLRVRKPAAEG